MSRQGPQLHCPHCQEGVALANALARCTDSWPNQRWVMFTCDKCEAGVHMEVANGRLDVGELDGGPGPCLMVSEAIDVPGLAVSVGGHGIGITYQGERRFIPARR